MNASNGTTTTRQAPQPVGNVTAVTGGLADAGCVTWWRLSGGLDLAQLREVWLSAELPEHWLPSEPAASTALRRAVSELREAHRLLRTTEKDSVLTIVNETEVDGELEFLTTFKARLDKVGRLQILKGKDADRERVEEAFNRYLNELTTTDVSTWLSKLMDRFDAVSLRDTGGVYFVPRFAVVRWYRAIGAIQETSKHALLYIPAMRSEDAVRAVFDAVGQEVRREVEAMRKDMTAGLGPRALQSRITAAEGAEQKLSRYEELFGGKLTELHTLLEGLRAEMTVAMFKAEEAEDAAP